MKPTVSQQTAKQLAEAGFLPPEVAVGQFWHKTIFEGGTAEHSALCICLSFGGQIVMQAVEPRWDYPGNSGPDKKALFAPTATDILAQFPGSLTRGIDGQWQCRFTIIQYDEDCYYDQCPHECAAKAFLAWKAGLS